MKFVELSKRYRTIYHKDKVLEILKSRMTDNTLYNDCVIWWDFTITDEDNINNLFSKKYITIYDNSHEGWHFSDTKYQITVDIMKQALAKYRSFLLRRGKEITRSDFFDCSDTYQNFIKKTISNDIIFKINKILTAMLVIKRLRERYA